MKQRSKEFGLYNILGMEKRHLGRVLVAESMISSTISIIIGLGVGILFSKLALMVITKMIGAGHIIAFEVNMYAGYAYSSILCYSFRTRFDKEHIIYKNIKAYRNAKRSIGP